MCRRERFQVIFWNIPRGMKLPHHTCGLSVNITTFSRLISDPCGRVSQGVGCKLFYFFFFLNLLSSSQYVFKFELFQIRIRFFQALFNNQKAGQHWAWVETVSSVFFSLVIITFVFQSAHLPTLPFTYFRILPGILLADTNKQNLVQKLDF